MSSRTLTYLIALAFVGMAVVLVNNMVHFTVSPQTEKYLSPYDVRGMAIEHEGKPYTLNFSQQNTCISALNRGLAIGKLRTDKSEDLPFEKLTIYRFNQTDVDLKLVDKSDQTLIFAAPLWNPGGYITEVSGGDMWKAIENSYGS